MASDGGQILTFEAGGQSLAIATKAVSEVVTTPRITRVPQAPASLKGLANLRGKVVPILSVEALLGGAASGTGSRIIVLMGDDPVGLAVDRVSAMRHIERAGDAEGAAQRAEADAPPTRLLEFGPLIAAAFSGLSSRSAVARASPPTPTVDAAPQEADLSFLQFELAGQAYALPLEQVREVTPAPRDAAALPHTDAAMVGVMPLRGELLPLVSMRLLLGLAPKGPEASDRVVVARLGDTSLGLVVDGVWAILRANERDVGAVPSVLNRGAGEARIDAMVRTPAGLVSVLATERIFLEETVARIIAEAADRPSAEIQREESGSMEQYVLFRLADETYGLPVGAVREVVRLPDAITRAPRAPDFVAGVMNHRGHVVPLIDQRRRFAVAGDEMTRQQRVIVVNVGDLVAGFIVDAVEQVLDIPAEAMRPTPELATADEPIFDRIATLDLDGRLVLLVDPRQLLDQAERDIVRDVARRSNAAPA